MSTGSTSLQSLPFPIFFLKPLPLNVLKRYVYNNLKFKLAFFWKSISYLSENLLLNTMVFLDLLDLLVFQLLIFFILQLYIRVYIPVYEIE